MWSGPYCGRQAAIIRSGDEDDDEVADKMGEDKDKELRWKDSGDLSSAVKTP